MVNTLSHIGVGFLIALALGFRGKKLGILGFLSILPDLDFLPNILFLLIGDSVSHEMRNQLFYLFGHREFMHSILFILLVTLFLWFKTKDLLFTVAGFFAIFSHVYLDYATSWKMRPFYPFSTETSTMGAIYFFDPLANLLPLIPVFILLVGYMKRRGKWKGRFNKFCTFVTENQKKFYPALLIILVVWLAILPLAKLFLVNHISDSEGAKISYQDTYPSSFERFLAAYPYNSTYYKILEVSYLSGIEKSEYVKKISATENISNPSAYAERAGSLYSTALPQEIDYPIYNISKNDSLVTVNLTDARDQYVRYWAYFDTDYRFVFDTENGNYIAYASVRGQDEEKLPENYFG